MTIETHAVMPFWDHLAEFRKMLVRSIIVLLLVTLATFTIAPDLFHLLQMPLRNVTDAHLIVLSPL